MNFPKIKVKDLRFASKTLLGTHDSLPLRIPPVSLGVRTTRDL